MGRRKIKIKRSFKWLKRNYKGYWYNAKNNVATGSSSIFYMACIFLHVDLYYVRQLRKMLMAQLIQHSKQFQDAGDWVGVMFMVYNGVSALAAFLLPILASKIGRKYTHMLCLILGGVGLITIFFIKDHQTLLMPMIFVGLAWASTLNYALCHSRRCITSKQNGFLYGSF